MNDDVFVDDSATMWLASERAANDLLFEKLVSPIREALAVLFAASADADDENSGGGGCAAPSSAAEPSTSQPAESSTALPLETDGPAISLDSLHLSIRERPVPMLPSSSSVSSGESPSRIVAVYDTDLDILKIHDAVRVKISHDAAVVTWKLQQALEDVAAADYPEFRRKADAVRLSALIKEADNANRMSLWDEYMEKAEPLLCSYAELKEAAATSQEATTTEQRLLLIRWYISVASRYIAISARRIVNPDECPSCGGEFGEAAAVACADYDMRACMQCGVAVASSVASASSSISEQRHHHHRSSGLAEHQHHLSSSFRQCSTTRNSYEDLGNFIKRIDAFECKQRTAPPPHLYNQLDSYFEANPSILRHRSREAILNEPNLPNGKKAGTSVAVIVDALRKTGNTAFFRDLELIGREMWGWIPADLGTLRWQLIDDYIATQKVYGTVRERDSSPNVSLRLYVHLRARNFPCDLEDFKIVSSRDSLAYHDRCLSVMFQKCGLPFVPLLPPPQKRKSAAAAESSSSSASESRG